MNIVKNIEVMAARLERAREIVKLGLIYPIYGDPERRYVCKSHSGQQDGNGQVKLYLVSQKGCTCADYRHLREVNGGWCKHRLARELILGGEQDDAGARRAADKNGVAHKGRTQPVGNGDRRRAARTGS